MASVTSRVEEAPLSVSLPRPKPRPVARAALLTGPQRILFVVALLTFGLASMYTSLALLARVTPALFPGKTLFSAPILASLEPLAVGIKPPAPESVFNKRINMLVLGVDKRPQYEFRDQDGYLTDVIMVATIDPVRKTVSLLSLPRDTAIEVHGPRGYTYENRINESYGLGVREGGGKPADGIEQLSTDLKANFGIEIDHYVILDFEGVAKLIDAVGGVEVDIPQDLAVGDWYYSDDDENGRWLSFPSGVNKLDGYNAVAFGRHREYDNDLKRVKRQQLIVTAAVSKVFQLGLLNNPFELWDAYSSTVKTDVPRSKMPGYGLLLKDTNGRIKTFSLGDPVNDVPTLVPFTGPGGAALLRPNADNVQYILSQVFPRTQYAESSVEIQNGYGVDGAVRAAGLGSYLKYVRFLPTVYHGPDQPPQPETTITIYGGNRAVADDIAKWMGVPDSNVNTAERGADDTLPDVVIIIGRNFKLPGG